ncbi:MAG: hypothetical protein M5U12_17425 [Verrucomicrobia bacterium]|nr:hypothetical protein [Verrucomicrobiota bacterium]
MKRPRWTCSKPPSGPRIVVSSAWPSNWPSTLSATRAPWTPSSWPLSLGEERLADYEPETHWERQPVTDKQAELLARAGFDLTRITCKGHASKWIDLLFRRRDLGLATPKQVRWLVHFGHPNPHLATFEEAGAYLDGKFTGRRRRSLVPTR